MTRTRSLWRWGALLVLVLGAVLGVASFVASRHQPEPAASVPTYADNGDEQPNVPVEVPVQTILPRTDPNFQMTVEQPAFVQAYYQADLMARVAGPIKFLESDIGDRLKAGDVVIQIDVPDLEEDVKQKEAIVVQRQRELGLAEANVKIMGAAVEAAKGTVQLKESEVLGADATRSFREKELKRFEGLAMGKSPGVTRDIVDERTQFYEAAVAASQAARAGVLKAKADLQESEAKLQATRADVRLKQALVDVAGKDRDRAKALLSFATLLAPFDSVVVRRNADPGSFVQNATTGRSEPIVTVARTDIVTVYMKLPDNYAPFVTRDSDTIIELGVLPGWQIQGKVTRFSPSLETPEHDRTMRVEVDLFNGTAAAYEKLTEKSKETHNAGLKSRRLPLFPVVKGKPTAGLDGRLLPGMFGKMKLVLRNFQGARLIPSTAIVSQGGRSYVFRVRDGKVVKTPVDVQVDDGRVAKVSLLENVKGQVVRKELTGDELIVASNQGELSDGQAVRAAEPSPW